MQNLAITCCTTELVRGMGLFLGWHHRLICITLSLCKHACKEVCDINPGIDPYPLPARSCNRWLDFVTFTACKKSRLGLKRGKKAQCVSNRCKELFKGKKYFGVRCTLMLSAIQPYSKCTKNIFRSTFNKTFFSAVTFIVLVFYEPSTGNLRKQGAQLISYGCKPTKQLGSCSSEQFFTVNQLRQREEYQF